MSDESGDRRAIDERARSLGVLYDAEYYAFHLGRPYVWGESEWTEFFGRIADSIVAELAPRTVLDAGCGIGFLVAALRVRGVDAYGIDVSPYAISQVPHDIEAYCRVASITEELERDYDLIVCIEVLEHLPADLGDRAIENLTRHAPRLLFSSTPTDLEEPTHLTVRPTEHWIELFARRGFFRNVEVDAGFVAPHAVHLVRSGAGAETVARDYERWYRLQLDALARARGTLDPDGLPYRLAVELSKLRTSLAPAGSARDRMLRAVGRGLRRRSR